MADLRLADAVDAAEALLQPGGVPGEVVVDEEVGLLQVHPLPGGVRGHQDEGFPVLGEAGLAQAALLPGKPPWRLTTCSGRPR